jgi:hypothetical protein
MRSFYRRWVMACTAGELIGISVAAAVAVTVNTVFGEPQSLSARLLTLGVFAVVGSIEGAALAGLQWRVLRERLPRLRLHSWVGATVAIAVIGWIAGMTPSLFLRDEPTIQPEPALTSILLLAAAVGAGAGLCFGAAQWVVLRRHAQHAGRWVWIHAPAWAVAMSAIFLGASLPGMDSPTWIIVVAGALGGVLGGVSLGLISGVVAQRLQPLE